MWEQERSQSGWVLGTREVTEWVGTREVTEWVGTGNRRGHRVGGYWEQRSQSGWVLRTGEVTEWVDTGIVLSSTSLSLRASRICYNC